ncbi:MAG: glycosyltransferase family 2 protein [Bacteroidales bacterium]|nr:glycosyltransferase family 2 protein [Bacteroidales bacterium]
MIELSIITVTMNHLQQVKDLLHSIYVSATPKVSFEVIIVDNCSTDGTINYIKQNYPQIKLICNDHIYGFAKNNNIGFKHSSGNTIAIINPDIILQQNSLDILHNEINNSSDIGIVCPQLLNPDLTRQASVRSFVTPYYLLIRFLTKGNDKTKNKALRKYLMLDFDSSIKQEIDWAIGAAYCIKRELYEEINGFDEGFFLYVEDVDMCKRIHLLGKKVVYIPNSKMIHIHNRSSRKKFFTKTKWYHFISFMYYFWKYYIVKKIS